MKRFLKLCKIVIYSVELATHQIIDKPMVGGDVGSCSNDTDSGIGQLKEDRRLIYVERSVAADTDRNNGDSSEGSYKVWR
jgi:hypothetical protein